MVFTAGQKVRASELNNAAAVGEMISQKVSTGTGDAMAFTTAEAVGTSLSGVQFVAGRTYLCEFTGVANVFTVGANLFLKIKYKAGATVDTTGTQVPDAKIAPNLSRGASLDNNPVVVRGYVTAPSTGSFVVVLTGKTSTSTGTMAADTSNHGWCFTVTCVKGA